LNSNSQQLEPLIWSNLELLKINYNRSWWTSI